MECVSNIVAHHNRALFIVFVTITHHVKSTDNTSKEIAA